MKAGVKEGTRKNDRPQFRVVDLDSPEQTPILNRSGEPVDGGGHRLKGISEMLAGEINEALGKSEES